ncbi:MAG TPA: alpha/beta hydrolase-fold protein [Archangium sp.]|jgi:predicted alpha/beta superfamily hydrolase|uniref:alpha/beta hydrolase n=1 Tax=Archangium sp. TaxID=1872627 RepID=UPI002EDA33CA
MTFPHAAKWLLLVPFVGAVLAGCGAIEPAPQAVPHASVTFDVTVPADTPAEAIITVVGSHLALGSDTAPGFQLRRQGDGHYTGVVRISQGAEVSYDLWQRDVWIPELSADGAPVPRRTFTVEGDMTVTVTVARWGAPSKGPAMKRGLTGIIRYHRSVSSAFLSRSRDVIVYLPPDYFDSPERRYPVLYMHDGQNLMDASTAFSGEWQVDETAEQLIQAGKVEPVIIVGVSNTSDRIPEYTPKPDPKYPSGGNADAYGRFLVEELKPMIDARYRTRPGPGDTGLAGSSLGGLVSLYLGLKYPGTFTRLGVLSPSVWWANKDIVEKVKALDTKPPLQLWVDMGTNEDTDALSEVRLLRDALMAEGWGTSDLKYVEVSGAAHNEAAWAARFGDVLRYLFPPR